jgi:hypothetical protein
MCVCIEGYHVQIQIEEDYEGEHRHVELDSILTLVRPEQEEKDSNSKSRRSIVVFAHGVVVAAGTLQGIDMLLQF